MTDRIPLSAPASRPPVTELDLLAYADGFLDVDPSRRAEVEAFLAESAPAARRVRTHMAQNEALRRAYGGRLAEPVPERLRAALEPPPRPGLRRPLRAAATLCLVLGASLAGWALGSREDAAGWSVASFVDQTHAAYVGSGELGLTPAALGAGANLGRPLGWLRDEISIRLRVPDLSEAGYSLVSNSGLERSNDQIVRLDYEAADGRSVTLFLTPRWEGGSGDISETRRDGVSVAWWLDGPLASSVVTRLPPEETREIAETLRRSLRDEGQGPVVVEPAAPRAMDEAMASGVDGLPEEMSPRLITAPRGPEIIQSN